MKRRLIEQRIIDTDKVRGMCINKGYYTSGSIEDYSKMFQKCKLNYHIIEIAIDILEHSNKEKLIYEYGNEKEVLENICFGLINDCCYTCVDIEVI